MSSIYYGLKRFGESTSIRGVSRIFKSKDYFLKIMWLCFVLACASMLIFLLATLFNKFYSWPTTTKFSEKLDGKIVFPDVTICNTNPFGNGYPSNVTFSDFGKFIKLAKSANISYSEDEQDLMDWYWSYLTTVPGYIVNQPKNFDLDNDCPLFIARCSLYSSNWVHLDDCTLNFTKNWNRNYHTCHTIRTSHFIKNYHVELRGMTLILNIGPPITDQMPFLSSLASTQAAGVRIAIHSPGTAPDFNRGITVGPGAESVVKITQKNIERLDKPYNRFGCTNREHIMGTESEFYSKDICVQYCMQKIIYENCNCVVNWYEIPDVFDDVISCENFSHYQTMDRFVCGASIRNNKVCKAACLLPCKEIDYSSTLDSSIWPPVSMQLSIYENYFKDCIENFPKVKKRYAAYEYLRRLQNEDLTENEKKNVNYTTSDLKQVRESMLYLKLVVENIPVSEVHKPLYSWDVMVGLVGGILSLWLGITVMTAVELLEMFYYIVMESCTKQTIKT